ncbi:hypothetical protein LguiA_036741 [Lonicera macranthoides]
MSISKLPTTNVQYIQESEDEQPVDGLRERERDDTGLMSCGSLSEKKQLQLTKAQRRVEDISMFFVIPLRIIKFSGFIIYHDEPYPQLFRKYPHLKFAIFPSNVAVIVSFRTHRWSQECQIKRYLSYFSNIAGGCFLFHRSRLSSTVGFFTLHHLYSTLGFLHTSPIARVHLPRFRLFFGNIHTGDLSIPTTISKAFKTHPGESTLVFLSSM